MPGLQGEEHLVAHRSQIRTEVSEIRLPAAGTALRRLLGHVEALDAQLAGPIPQIGQTAVLGEHRVNDHPILEPTQERAQAPFGLSRKALGRSPRGQRHAVHRPRSVATGSNPKGFVLQEIRYLVVDGPRHDGELVVHLPVRQLRTAGDLVQDAAQGCRVQHISRVQVERYPRGGTEPPGQAVQKPRSPRPGHGMELAVDLAAEKIHTARGQLGELGDRGALRAPHSPHLVRHQVFTCQPTDQRFVQLALVQGEGHVELKLQRNLEQQVAFQVVNQRTGPLPVLDRLDRAEP